MACYDTPCDRRRRQLSDALGEFGTRVQESVFECRLDEAALRELRRCLEAIATADDDVRLYPLCARCAQQPLMLGRARLSSEPAFYIA